MRSSLPIKGEARPLIAVLDDYGGRARSLADWSSVERHASIDFLDGPIAPAVAAKRLADYNIICLMRERTAMPGGLITALPRLRAIVTTGRLPANLDAGTALRMNVRVVAAEPAIGGGGATDVAELAWGLILASMRGIVAESRAVQAGGWQRGPGRSLRGMTLGLLGFGRVGKAMVPIAHAFGTRVVTWSPSLTAATAADAGAELVPRDLLFARSDIVSLHLPANATTHSSVGRRELAIINPGAVLINTSRAAVLDHRAMLDALYDKRLAGAALDVFDEEPLPMLSALRGVPNLLLTPHLGYATERGLAELYSGIIASLLKLTSQPRSLLDLR